MDKPFLTYMDTSYSASQNVTFNIVPYIMNPFKIPVKILQIGKKTIDRF